MTQEHKQLLQGLTQTNFGQALKVYLEEELAKIGDLSSVKDWEETRGKQIAIKLIKDLFAFMEESKVRPPKPNQYV